MSEPNERQPTYRDLPLTLPSLAIAVLRLPVPMEPEDYDRLVETLALWETALIAREPTHD